MNQLLTLADLLAALGHTDGDHVSICHQPPGGTFTSQVTTTLDAPTVVPPTGDVWFGVNPVEGPARVAAGRGTADTVTRLVALYADLDVKSGGLADFDTAHTIVDVLTDMLGTRPTAVTLSGNGLQPFWPIEDTITGPDARALLRRFGRLVTSVADRYHGKVDSVYDLARVLRVPGTHNHKSTPPKPVMTLGDRGRPLTVDEIREALDAYGIPEHPEDRETLAAVQAPPSEWTWATRTCPYVKAMIDGWATNTPDARHPWLLGQATRLAAAHRHGCITQPDHAAATATLANHFRTLLANTPARKESPGEIADALGWGQARIAAKTATAVIDELGTHSHDDAILQLLPERPTTPPPAAPATAWTPTVIQGGAATDGATALQPSPAATTLDRSEDGHAQHLIEHYGDLIRYCPQRGLWLTWDGCRWAWQPKGGGQVREYAKNVARTFPHTDQAALSHKRRALSNNGTTGCLKQAETDPRVVVNMGDLDTDPYLLNTPAGAVDLRTGNIAPPDPTSLCTKITTVAPTTVPDPIWARFLDDTFAGDTALRDYVQRLVGVTLLGQVREQLLAFLHGLGANGKSTLVEALMHAIGVGETGYAIAAPAEMLMIRKHSEHPAELAQLSGARMVVCSELDDGQRFAEAKIKQLTGRDSINARFLYGQPFTFTPSHTIWLLGNHRPQAKTGGMAFWRRVKLVEFAHVVPDELRDPALGDRLNAAAATVLAWAIQGAVDYLTHGIQEPAAVSQATRAYAEDQDTIARFVEDLVHLSPNTTEAKVQVVKLRAAYESWCHEAGEEPSSAKRLTQELRDRFGVSTGKSNGRRYYVGLTLLASDDDPTESDPAGWYR